MADVREMQKIITADAIWGQSYRVFRYLSLTYSKINPTVRFQTSSLAAKWLGDISSSAVHLGKDLGAQYILVGVSSTTLRRSGETKICTNAWYSFERSKSFKRIALAGMSGQAGFFTGTGQDRHQWYSFIAHMDASPVVWKRTNRRYVELDSSKMDKLRSLKKSPLINHVKLYELFQERGTALEPKIEHYVNKRGRRYNRKYRPVDCNETLKDDKQQTLIEFYGKTNT